MNIAFAVTFLVINAKVLLITKMNNRIGGAETIGLNSRIKVHFASYNCLQSLGLNVFDNLGIDTSACVCRYRKRACLFSAPLRALTFFVARAKVRFIEFDFA